MNNIETIGTSQVLKDAGIEPSQAEAIATVVVAQRDGLAMKSNISSLRTELKSDIEALRVSTKSDISSLRTELKSDIEALRVSTKSDISSLRTELKTDIAELKSDIAGVKSDFDSHRKLFENKINNLRWTMVVVGGVVVTLVKYLP